MDFGWSVVQGVGIGGVTGGAMGLGIGGAGEMVHFLYFIPHHFSLFLVFQLHFKHLLSPGHSAQSRPSDFPVPSHGR